MAKIRVKRSVQEYLAEKWPHGSIFELPPIIRQLIEQDAEFGDERAVEAFAEIKRIEDIEAKELEEDIEVPEKPEPIKRRKRRRRRKK